jgi:hypothetical protein
MNEGYIYLQGEGHKQHQGPFTEQELRRYWAYGIISSNDWVWHAGMDNCVQVKDFFDMMPNKIGEKVAHQLIIHQPANLELDAELPVEQYTFDKTWILQVFAWLVALAATVCFLSLPSVLWLSIFLYAGSLGLLAWFIWIRKSAIAWVSLGMNVLLMAIVLYLQPHEHEQAKAPVSEPVMIKMPAQNVKNR